jgi:hypothetical protein
MTASSGSAQFGQESMEHMDSIAVWFRIRIGPNIIGTDPSSFPLQGKARGLPLETDALADAQQDRS